jgi:serine protease Do
VEFILASGHKLCQIEGGMNLNRSFIRMAAAVLALTSGIVVVRFVAHAVETGPAIRVDSTPINRDPQSGNSYSSVVKKVAPSVVNIYSSGIVRQQLDPFLRQFFGQRETTHRENWLGCGIVVAPNGYILTANHVVEGADEIKVGIQNDKTEYSARVIGMDPPTDVAILKIDAKDLPAVTLGDSDQLEVGDVVLAIGNPFGIGQTVTRGIISALGRSLSDPSDPDSADLRQYQDFIQTDAAINEGNSGGALVDAEGRLIGINDAIVSPSGASAGIGFAVPVNLARSVMQGFISNGRVARGFIGIGSEDIDSGLAKAFGAPSTQGALVTEVVPNSPAAMAGLLSGDVIVAVNDKEISGEDNFRVTVSQLAPGSQARLKIYRDGAPKTIALTLAARPDDAQASTKPSGNNLPPAKADALDGVGVQDLGSHVRRQLVRMGAPQNIAGAMVTDVDHHSNSYEAGLRPDDVILEINRQAVASADDAVRKCKAATSEKIVVKLWRPTSDRGRILFLDVDNTKRAN